MNNPLELTACTPHIVHPNGFNSMAQLPYGLTVEQVEQAMQQFNEFLGFVNQQLHTKELSRLESMLMQANFSSMVGEFMNAAIPKYCPTLVKNKYHNGHPDLIPATRFPGDAVQHADQGIEIKASRYAARWQGHNPEDTWLMVFIFDCNRPSDSTPKPFRFVQVVGDRLTQSDWIVAGRSATSRRTITASVTTQATARMKANWIYQDICG